MTGESNQVPDRSSSRVSFHVSGDELDALITKAVTRGNRQTFIMLGIDLDDAEQIAQWHKQQGVLRDLVAISDGGKLAKMQGWMTVKTSAIIVFLSAAVSWATAHFGSPPVPPTGHP